MITSDTPAVETQPAVRSYPVSPIGEDNGGPPARHRQHVYEPVPAIDPLTVSAEASDRAESTSTIPEGSNKVSLHPSDIGLLKRSRFHWSVLVPLDLALALSPVFFFVIASLCLFLQDRPKSAYGERIKAITLVAPSIFPILYAAILGRMLRRVGLYKAERSATLGTVERLVGCQSVFTAIERQIALRHFDFLGCSILIAWLLSPLGGQASLRMLSSQPVVMNFQSNIKYYPIEAYYPHTYLFGSGQPERTWPLWGPLYMTALQTSRESLYSPMDLFQNVKIPDLHQPSISPDQFSDYDWRDFSDIDGIQYTSMLGLPLAGVPSPANSTFNTTSFYWSVDCNAWKRQNVSVTEYSRTPSFNFTLDADPDRQDALYDRIRFLYKTRQVTKQIDKANAVPPYVNYTAMLSTAVCYATPLVVESRIACQDRSCSVRGMRRVQRDARHLLSPYDPIIDFLTGLFSKMPGAGMVFTGETTTQSSELVEQWIADPTLHQFTRDESASRPNQWSLEQRWVNLALLSPADFSRRLQIAMNTFWDASVGSDIRTGNFTLDQVARMTQKATFTWNSTALAGVKHDGEKYTCNIAFATITIAIAFALFLAAVISLILGIVIKAPDILGFVSTSARDNPYVDQQVNSRSDGLEAARALRDVRVRIGDVSEGSGVGHVAFTTTTVGRHAGLSRKRLYD